MKWLFALAGLTAAALVSGCHPTSAERQDVLDGMAFAQDHIPINGHMGGTYSDFTNEGEFLRRSKYFKAGADYRAFIIMEQVSKNLEAADNTSGLSSEMAASIAQDTAEEKADVNVALFLAYVALEGDLKTISETPEKFSKIVGDDQLASLMKSVAAHLQASPSDGK